MQGSGLAKHRRRYIVHIHSAAAEQPSKAGFAEQNSGFSLSLFLPTNSHSVLVAGIMRASCRSHCGALRGPALYSVCVVV